MRSAEQPPTAFGAEHPLNAGRKLMHPEPGEVCRGSECPFHQSLPWPLSTIFAHRDVTRCIICCMNLPSQHQQLYHGKKSELARGVAVRFYVLSSGMSDAREEQPVSDGSVSPSSDSSTPSALFVGACVVLPILWGVIVHRVFRRLRRQEKTIKTTR